MIEFSPSAQSTLGVEWEMVLVDRTTGEPVAAGPEFFHGLEHERPDLTEQDEPQPIITPEFLANSVELVTGVCGTVAEALEQLRALKAEVDERADALGVDLYSEGTHPTARWDEQAVTPKPRYEKVLERTQYWGRQMMIWGLHVHVGLDSRDKAFPAVNHLVNHYAHLLAISASSPFWEGTDTGYASQRAMTFQQIPTAGLPYAFREWSEFERYTQDLLDTGVIEENSENRWDIRPVPRYGTVEVRVCDGVATLEEMGAVIALVQCLVEEASRLVEAGQDIPEMPRWHAEENKWRAARYGLDADVILGADNAQKPLREHLGEVLDRLGPIAEELDCAAEFAGLRGILERGPGYVRQRRVAAEHDGDLRAVVADSVALTRAERR